MTAIGKRCHELRVSDETATWRIVDNDAIVILDVFSKKSAKTPRHVIEACRERLRRFESLQEGG